MEGHRADLSGRRRFLAMQGSCERLCDPRVLGTDGEAAFSVLLRHLWNIHMNYPNSCCVLVLGSLLVLFAAQMFLNPGSFGIV